MGSFLRKQITIQLKRTVQAKADVSCTGHDLNGQFVKPWYSPTKEGIDSLHHPLHVRWSVSVFASREPDMNGSNQRARVLWPELRCAVSRNTFNRLQLWQRVRY